MSPQSAAASVTQSPVCGLSSQADRRRRVSLLSLCNEDLYSFIGASLTFVQSVSVTASHLHITLYFFPFPLYCIQHCKELLL